MEGTAASKGENHNEDVDEVDRIESDAKTRAAGLLAMKESGPSVSDDARSEAIGHKEGGNRLYREGLLEDAIDEYTSAIDADPTDTAFYSNRSACLASLDRYEEALLADAAVARHLDPRWPKGCFRLATARLDGEVRGRGRGRVGGGEARSGEWGASASASEERAVGEEGAPGPDGGEGAG